MVDSSSAKEEVFVRKSQNGGEENVNAWTFYETLRQENSIDLTHFPRPVLTNTLVSSLRTT